MLRQEPRMRLALGLLILSLGCGASPLPTVPDGAVPDAPVVSGDTSPPGPPGPIMHADEEYTGRVSPSISWSQSIDEGGSGLSHYELALGKSPGAEDVAAYRRVDLPPVTIEGLALAPGTTCYAAVRAVDHAGNVSTVTVSKGWRVVDFDATPYAALKPQIAAAVAANGTPTPTISTFPSGSFGLRAGLVAANGKAYSLGCRSVRVIDPAARTVSTIGTPTGCVVGGARSAQGFIYGFPSSGTQLVKVDPLTDQVTIMGDFSDGLTERFDGAVAAAGKIWAVPRRYGRPVRLDPADDSFADLSDPSCAFGTGNEKWSGAALAPTGAIYGAPLNRQSFLKIDPASGRCSEISTPKGGFGGLALAANGLLYALGPDVLYRLDPTTDKVTTLPYADNGNTWAGLTFAPDGRLYAAPAGASTDILVIDTRTDTVSRLPTGYTGGFSNRWFGATLLPGGRIVFYPRGVGDVLLLELPLTQDFPMGVFLSPYVNSF